MICRKQLLAITMARGFVSDKKALASVTIGDELLGFSVIGGQI